MNIATTRRPGRWLIAALLLALGGCAAPGVGHDYGEGYYGSDGYYGGAAIGYGLGFQEPLGFDYGVWSPGYRIGPPPQGKQDRMARPVPSIPAHPRARRAPGQQPPGDGARHH